MIRLQPHPEGVILEVRAQPGARKNGIIGEYAGALKLAVTAAPERGRANKALIELLREVLGLKRFQVELLSGDASQNKSFLIRGLSVEELQARLACLIT